MNFCVCQGHNKWQAVVPVNLRHEVYVFYTHRFFFLLGSELVQKYVGEGARMVRELFEMARSKKACLIFFDEIDAIGGAR